jgi:predicted SnoaL-like aldol condensation-catalyzing enzyme
MDNPMNYNKEAAINFLQLVASAKTVRKAYQEYAAVDFRHHNIGFKGDAESLMLAMEENAAANPQKALEIKHAIQEGDLVAVHSHVKLNPADHGFSLVHIFRFENKRIVELWDMGMAVPPEMVNENGMF